MDAATPHLRVPLPTRRATRRLGAALGGALASGDLIVLEGGLGAGKTFLVRAIARALGVEPHIPVTSPTFALVHELPARVPLVHADLYRLRSVDELLELGLVDRIGHDAVVLVEWGERFLQSLGRDGVLIRLGADAAGVRNAELEALGIRGASILVAVREALARRR